WQHVNPGEKSMLVALHTINGAVKWSAALEIDGLSGADRYAGNGDYHSQKMTPLADIDGKILCATGGDTRHWAEAPGSAHNPQGAEYDGQLRPMTWCYKDNGNLTTPTLLWTRAMSAGNQPIGPATFSIAPNYRLLYAAELDPEWATQWTTAPAGWYNQEWHGFQYRGGVHIIHPDDIHITDVYYTASAKDVGDVTLTFTSQDTVGYDVQKADADAYSDGVTWTTLSTVTATGASTTVTDSLGAGGLPNKFRF
ncbi:unnamed protein product, partial [marine sediment metagenome]